MLIMLVESDPDAATHARSLLAEATGHAFEVTAARDPGEAEVALAGVHRVSVDVVLHVIQRLDGAAEAAVSRLAAAAAPSPVVVLAAHEDESSALRALDRGAQEFLPAAHASARMLARTLLYAVERRRAGEALRSIESQLVLSQKLEAVGRLAGGVAHDFNNILTTIIGYSDLLIERMPPGHPDRKFVGEIQKAGQRATALTQQLLAFSRKQVHQPRVLDLNAEIRDLDEMLRRLIGEDIEVRMVLGQDLGHVKADPGQVEQVIMNLLVNARDAMPGGGRLLIETGNAWLDEDYAMRHVSVRPGPYVRLVVTDSGHGMDRETQAHIFEPFFTTKEKGKGTGLGLSTVYGIVKQTGGNIWVYSEPGKGTTFKIYLPRVTGGGEPAPAVPASTAVARGTETILLVEDESSVRALASDVLKSYGYTVVVAPDGAQALTVQAAHAGPIHLLLTDVVMPQMSGRVLADRLRPQRPDMKVLFMSGYTEDAIIQHGLLVSGIAFLEKPFPPSRLAAKVREVLDAPPQGQLPLVV